MTTMMRSGSSPFVPRARLLKLLGGELIRDEVMAVVELVKNAHDADASRVRVVFEGVNDGTGEIRIEDDGEGMDLERLLGHWMQPAGSSKRGLGNRRTALGRRLLGEKGVGRFAVDRLGAHLELVSRRVDADSEVVMHFDWDRFDSEHLPLSEVHANWTLRDPQHFIHGSGTLLRVTGLRTPWTERMFRRLSTRLQRLLNPFSGDHAFTIEVDSDEFPDYSGTLRLELLERAPYRLEASFDGEVAIHTRFHDEKPVVHTWNGAGDLHCGPLRVILFAFDLESDSLSQLGPPPEVRAWLREWSGISIYRDGFRVLPYGEPDDDWLRLDQRRVNNPVVRLSNNQVCGFVQISSDDNPELRDQTNRGGLIENQASADLRRLMHHILQIIESERQRLRHPPVESSRPTSFIPSGDESETGPLQALEQLGCRLTGRDGEEVRRLARELAQDHERREAHHRRERDGFANLAAFGQGAVRLHHVVKPRLERVREQLHSLGKRSQIDRELLSTLKGEIDAVEEGLSVLGEMDPGIGRRRRTIDLVRELQHFHDMVLPLVKSQGISLLMNLPVKGPARVEFTPAVLRQVLQVLLVNAMDWLYDQETRWISLGLLDCGDWWQIIFADSGPGIDPGLLGRVFEPGFSLKENGTGMGLTVARHLLDQHGGQIVVMAGDEPGTRIGVMVPARVRRRLK